MARLDSRGNAVIRHRAWNTTSRNAYPRMVIQVTGTAEVQKSLALLSDAIRKRITRYAVAAAARPILRKAKEMAGYVSRASRRKEGFGTYQRAMAVKVATAKSNPNVSYAIIGADRHYVELLDLQNAYQRSHVMNIRFQKRGKGGVMKAPQQLKGQRKLKFGAKSRVGAARDWKTKQLTGGAVRRRPSKYAHLLEYGTRRSAPHPVIGPASQANFGAREAFRQTFIDGVNREVAKLSRSTGRAAG